MADRVSSVQPAASVVVLGNDVQRSYWGGERAVRGSLSAHVCGTASKPAASRRIQDSEWRAGSVPKSTAGVGTMRRTLVSEGRRLLGGGTPNCESVECWAVPEGQGRAPSPAVCPRDPRHPAAPPGAGWASPGPELLIPDPGLAAEETGPSRPGGRAPPQKPRTEPRTPWGAEAGVAGSMESARVSSID